MKGFHISLYATSVGVAVAMLSGCGGSQPPIGASGAMPQSRAIATHAVRSGSWMLPEAKSEDLLYATGGCLGICVFSYPRGKIIGSLATIGQSVCADGSGNVFITQNQHVIEYAHGGTSPIATLTLPGLDGWGCSVDPTTGNLGSFFPVALETSPYLQARVDRPRFTGRTLKADIAVTMMLATCL